jgi:hypothetical protein
MPYNNLYSCATRGGIAAIRYPGQKRPSYKLIRFRCGRLDCPVCRNIKRKRLIRRLHAAAFPKIITFWTITTDPKVLDPQTATETINHRWHQVCRNLLRAYPGIKYFRVLEFTRSGLPHLHVIFDRYVDWSLLQSMLINKLFGEVLHFKRIPRDQAFAYLTKYLSKALDHFQLARDLHLRTWSCSLHFLPSVHYFNGHAEFKIIVTDWLGPGLEALLSWLARDDLEPVEDPPG